jgi:signal transduction histidine kinase
MSWEGRRAPSRPLTLALIAIGASMALAAFVLAVIDAAGPFEPLWLMVGVPITGVAYGVVGLVAWRRRPSNLIGPLLVLGGWTWLVVALEGTGEQVLVVVALSLATLPVAVMIHIVLAFPSGRLGGRAALIIAVAAYVNTTLIQIPQYMVRPSPMQLSDNATLEDVVRNVQRVIFLAVAAALVVVVVRRLQVARPTNRRVLLPVYVYGVVAVGAIVVTPTIEEYLVAFNAEHLAIVQYSLATGFPFAFAIGLLFGFARSGEVEELASRLSDDVDRERLVVAIADALGDPSAELRFWMDGRYVDHGGQPVGPLADDRGVASIDLGNRHIGVIVYDASLFAEPELPLAAARMLALALDRERLNVELVASRDALRESRARLVDAGDRERRRIARDLHDGLQARLVLLGLRAAQLADVTEGNADALHVRDGIDAAIAELRGLVQGVMPALLLERGLYAATEDLVERMPVPAGLEVHPGSRSLPPSVESGAYFVVAEALSNAVKHARAEHLWVRLTHDDDVLRIEVRDDGIGGVTAPEHQRRGTGLRGIEERVEVLGGRLVLDSPPGGGTLVRADVPC